MKKEYQNNRFSGFPKKIDKNFWCYPKIMDNWWYILKGSEQKVLDVILRQTWGFNNKKSDMISLSQLEKGIKGLHKGTGLTRPTIIKTIKNIENKGFIKKTKKGKINCYELVKEFNQIDKEFSPIDSKEFSHTIDNITIDNKQYSFSSNKEKVEAYKQGTRWEEKPYFWNEEMRWVKKEQLWKVIPKDGSAWLEFAGLESEIEWRQKPWKTMENVRKG